MPEDRRLSISSQAHVSPDDVARHTFATVRRGFDPTEVRDFLDSVAEAMRFARALEDDLRHQVAEAEERAAHPVLDEDTLTSALGTETARVLRTAHEAAHDMVANAESEAERLRTSARDAAAELEARTEATLATRSAEVEAGLAELRHRAEADAADTLAAARSEAEALLDRTRHECRQMVEEAQALRTRVLADLARRRKAFHAQIEQLRAGRERLAVTVRDVRHSIDSIADEIFRAEDEARLAAEAAGREAAARADELEPVDEGEAHEPGEQTSAVEVPVPEAEAGAGAVPGPPRADETEAEGVDEAPAVEEPTAEVVVEAPTAEVAASSPDAGPEGSPTEGPVATGDDGDSGSPSSARGRGRRTRRAAPSADAVFAKIRAAREAAEAAVADVPGDEEAHDEEAHDEEAHDEEAHDEEAHDEEAHDEEAHDEEAHDEEAHDEEAHDEEAHDEEAHDEEAHDEPEGPPEATPPLVLRRDELLAPVVTALARRLKRLLQDQQNDVLDRLRSAGSRWSSELVPDADDGGGAFVSVSLDHLRGAAELGASLVEGAGPARVTDEDLDEVARDLQRAIVGPLQRRLEGERSFEPGDERAAAEHVGAAFREWKGGRVEELATDHLLAAFALGTRAALAARVRGEASWVAVPSSDGPPCPDCEDNALAGPTPVAEPFPTGHRVPPAHPGCRCLLAPVDA